jgi:hypothetical protein
MQCVCPACGSTIAVESEHKATVVDAPRSSLQAGNAFRTLFNWVLALLLLWASISLIMWNVKPL